MRALVLLLLCVVLLAVLQASYIVTEAKKHNEMRGVTDDAERETKHEKKMRRKGKNGGKDKSSELEITDDSVPNGYKVNDLVKIDPDMPSDEPASERSGRRERVSKDERRARKEERKGRKEDRKERKEQRKAAKAERKEKKGNKQEKNERKQGKAEKKAEKKAERKAERKNNRQQRKEERQQQVTCTSDTDCQEGECCVPKRGGEMMCKANRKPRKAGKRCVTSCACDGDMACYSENPAPDAPKRPRNRQLGKCVAPSEADLTKGTILTAAPQETAPEP